jgi:type IV fimbrial biogenesis protein FimT
VGVRQLLDHAQGGDVLIATPSRHSAAGFTLIELMIAIAIVSMLLVLGVPTLRGVIENTRIRTVAESWNYGISLARNNAVRLNVPVEFLVDNTGWQVRRRDPANAGAFIVLHRGSGKEGTANLTITLDPADADRVTFNQLGRIVAASMSDNSVPFTTIDFESENPSGTSGYRPLRIQLLAGGLTRLCDPSVDNTDPRVCL